MYKANSNILVFVIDKSIRSIMLQLQGLETKMENVTCTNLVSVMTEKKMTVKTRAFS